MAEESKQQAGFAGVHAHGLEHLIARRRPRTGRGRGDLPPGGVAPAGARHPSAASSTSSKASQSPAYGDDEPRVYPRRRRPCRTALDLPHTLFRNCDSERPLRFLTIYALERGRSLHHGAVRPRERHLRTTRRAGGPKDRESQVGAIRNQSCRRSCVRYALLPLALAFLLPASRFVVAVPCGMKSWKCRPPFNASATASSRTRRRRGTGWTRPRSTALDGDERRHAGNHATRIRSPMRVR